MAGLTDVSLDGEHGLHPTMLQRSLTRLCHSVTFDMVQSTTFQQIPCWTARLDLYRTKNVGCTL